MRKIGYEDKKGRFVPLYELPESLVELSAEHFPFYCSLADRINSGDITEDRAAVELALRFVDPIPDTYNERAKENVAFVARFLYPLFGDTLEHTDNPLPEIILRDGTRVKALGYGFYNATARQYLNITADMSRYFADQTGDNLNRAVASLFPTEDNLRESVRYAVRGLSQSLKRHLFFHIAASHAYLSGGTFDFFGIDVCFSNIFSIRTEKDTDGQKKGKKGFADALMSVAETGVFGPLDNVYQTNIVVLLRFMQSKYEEEKKLKSRYNAKK